MKAQGWERSQRSRVWLKAAVPSWGRRAICGGGDISACGVEEPLLEGVLFLMRVCCFLHLIHSLGTCWVPGLVPWGDLGLNS